jgi:acetyl-CoA carboxylase biotin carboxyl carrier protein
MSTNDADKDVAFIRALAELLHDTDLNEIEVRRDYGDADALKVRLSRGGPPAPAQPSAPAPAPAAGPAAAAPQPAASAPAPQPEAKTDGPDLSKALTSPMVGTVYLAPEPGSDPFVSVGDTVAEGDTVVIIEAMKTMNQIPAPRGGTVRQILVGNAEPVEFGAPLMIID